MTTTYKTDLFLIPQQQPLVHSITNHVVMDFNANALLAIGASPIMAHAEPELPELMAITNALVLNIGTLDEIQIKQMHTALQHVKAMPVVLDPVGAGASTLRTSTALDILSTKKISVLRGNAAEILALAKYTITSTGVDSRYTTDAAIDAAKQLAEQYQCIVVVSGAVDQIISSTQQQDIKAGHPLMAKVTGMGCTSSCIVAAFCAVNKNYFDAAAHAMTLMGIAGERAAKTAQGPASFKLHFIDYLYQLTVQHEQAA